MGIKKRLFLQGLSPESVYQNDDQLYSGSELMNARFIISDASSGQNNEQNIRPETYDFDSRIWVFTQKED